MYTNDFIDDNETTIFKMLDAEIHDRLFNEFK